MKQLILIGMAMMGLFAACIKEHRVGKLPGIETGGVTDSLAGLRAWVEQIAQQKRDSMRIVDSLANANHTVDTNSLFHKKNMMIAIVEVNDHVFANVNCFVDTKGKPMFDLAFPFSANMHIDPNTKKAFVYYNPEHQAMLRLGVFTAVKNKGVPIGLSILGDHDDAGLSNFASLADARDFAQLVAIEVRKLGFSAVLTDDEYSNYVSTADPNSYLMFMSEMKRLLPDIYLCYYMYGGGGGTYNGQQMGDIADALFTPFYPQYPDDRPFGAPNSKTFASSTTAGSFFDPAATMAQLKQEGRGGLMIFNVSGDAASASLYAQYALGLKGMTLNIPSGCLNPTEVDFVNGR